MIPIPAQILRSTATVKACTSLDKYQNPVYTDYTVSRIHIQPTNEIRKTSNNTDCTLRSLIFADARLSTKLDWWGLFSTAHAIGGDVRVIVRGVEYTVFTVDELRDDHDRFYGWEIGLR